MIALPPTNQVAVFTYMNSLRTSAECGYLRGQVDRLQHEVDLLEIGLLIFFGLLVVTVAALLMSLERNRRMAVVGIERTAVSDLETERLESKSRNQEAKPERKDDKRGSTSKKGQAIRWCGLILFWATYSGGLYYMYVACAPDWRRILFMTLLLQSLLALAAFWALWRPRFWNVEHAEH